MTIDILRLKLEEVFCREHKEGSFWQYTPDNEEFVSLASLYAKKHSTMSTVSASCSLSSLSLLQNRQRCIQDTTKFEDGITNGFDW